MVYCRGKKGVSVDTKSSYFGPRDWLGSGSQKMAKV